MTGDDHERHLQRERNQIPEPASPGVDDLSGSDGAVATHAGDDDDQRGEQREDERVRHPPLGPRRQRQRKARNAACGVWLGCAGRRLAVCMLVMADARG